MNKKIVSILTAAAVGAAVVTGCSASSKESANKTQTDQTENTDAASSEEAAESETADTDSEESSETTQIANPWTESDEEGVAEATGFVMTPPEDATEVAYSYMSEDGLAQMSYTLDGAQWNYRMQMADELTDISGLSYEWGSELDGTVADLPAKYYGYAASEEEGAEMVHLVNWYDAVAGVTYSLSASGTDLDGMDIQVYAENIYQPLQGEATGDPEGDRRDELDNYFLGEHVKSYDSSSVTISENDDGTFAVNISIFRLCDMDGTGTFQDHKMYFEVTDPSGGTMGGMIYRDSDNSLSITITDSTWDLLPNGEVIEGFGK